MLLTLKKMFFFGKNSFPAKLFCMIAVKKRKRNLLLESDFVPRMRRSSALSRFPPPFLKAGSRNRRIPEHLFSPFLFPLFLSYSVQIRDVMKSTQDFLFLTKDTGERGASLHKENQLDNPA